MKDVAAPLGIALLVAASVLTSCSGGAGTDGSTTQARSFAQPSPDAREEVPSALDNLRHSDFPDPLIDLKHVISGGPPPDGIPPIDDPTFQPARTVDWLKPTEPVLALTVDDETRAYPLQVMTWHEIVNDTVGGVPLAVTYCPLCNSGVAFHRRVDDRLLDFGTSGKLYADNLIMYDRQTESLWPQLTGQASVGVLTGTQLTALPMGVTGWDQFRMAHPRAWVLTRDTGHERDYGHNPYAGYDDPDGKLLVEPPAGRDPRLPVKERVIGIRIGGQALAIPRHAVADGKVLTVTLDGRELVVWHQRGQSSALDEDTIAKGREIGTVGVFEPQVRGRRLTFSATRDGFRDAQTGSTWNIGGEAVAGPLKDEQLDPVVHLDTFWFAWVAFQPKTTLHRSAAR